ncbi:MAG: AAA family ATPase [Candidatus Gastranaerophilales bacterium]|nr:AAA family ATPase [Candidatus Gastranaerophilales bacterium]
MDIKQAKDDIKRSVKLYLKKDEFGEYRVPVVRQRPIFLLGAPGIGKTAIMEQIAQELGIALVAYSMTHHTRQSALGLPFITQKTYGGKEYSVSEYTMSEIIASIYDTMESSGIREGILFLDEINCVSETLAPSMLQFLQYKVFGRHKVPEGWVIVTAGNPPEYNKSVREFDVVTMDRLKLLEVEPDYRTWKTYASERRLHGAIVSYLDLKKDHFYCMEMTAKGRSYVTARGWEDLSQILLLYEEEQMPVDESLVGQYLRNDRVVKEFTAYYDLYNKYKKDYRIEEILEGKPSERALARVKEAGFDERLSLLGMILDRVQADMKDVMGQGAYLSDLSVLLRAVKGRAEALAGERTGVEQLLDLLDKQAQGRRKLLESLQIAGSLSEEDRRKHRLVIRFLEESRKALYVAEAADAPALFLRLKEWYQAQVEQMKEETERVRKELHSLFAFVEEAFAEGNEMLILVTELTVNRFSAQFIATFGSDDYQRHNKELMIGERSQDIQAQIAELNL